MVLENIHLRVDRKEIVSIVGPNGGGKTTLLNTILGYKVPSQGHVQVMGETVNHRITPGLIGYLPQTGDFERTFPVSTFDVVAMSRFALKRPGGRLNDRDREQIIDALRLVEMEPHAKAHFGSLSGGQQQRILIARALALDPQILLLDEPSTGLDAVAQDTFYALLHKIRDSRGLTIVMVSHDVGTVSAVVDQIACLNKTIHFHGKPEDGIPSDALERVFGKHIDFLIHDERCQTCEERR